MSIFIKTKLAECLLLIVFCLMSLNVALAQDKKSNINLSSLAGLYFMNYELNSSPRPEEAETVSDVLEIVPYNKKAAYIRTKLFFNFGHSCDFSGFAIIEGNKLTSYDNVFDSVCIMDLSVTKDKITLSDRYNTCRLKTCGVRGGYNQTEFLRTQKRKITYLDKLKNSSQFKTAEENYKVHIKAIE
jgi:hypothetical protein